MAHLSMYSNALGPLLPVNPLYDEYLANNFWRDSRIGLWPDQGPVSAPVIPTTPCQNDLMGLDAISDFLQPQSDESTIVVRQTPSETAGNNEYEDFHFDVVVSTQLPQQAQEREASEQPDSAAEKSEDPSITWPSPGDMVSISFR